MDTIDAVSMDAERNNNWKKAKLENGFYNIIDGEKLSPSKRLTLVDPATGKRLAAIPDVDRTLLNKAISAGRNAFPGWRVVPFERRKAMLASLLNKIDSHVDELCALLTTEQGGPLAQAREEIALLTKAFGPALMQMAPPAKEQDAQPHRTNHEALCPDRRRRQYQPMGFAGYTFICEGTPSVTGW